MATKAKDRHCGKEKSRLSLSSPQTVDIYYIGKDHDPLILIEKPAPNYLRPTLSFANEVCCRYSHRHASPKGLSSRKFRHRHPPTSEFQKTPLSPSSREELYISCSQRFTFDRALRKLKNGNIQHSARTRKLKQKASNSGTSQAAGNLGYNPQVASTSDHDKVEELTHEVVVEMLQSNDGEQIVLELPPTQFQELCDFVVSEMDEIHDGEPEDLEKVVEAVEENIKEGPSNENEGEVRSDGTGGDSEESINTDGEDAINQEVIIQSVTIVAAPFDDEEKATKLKLLRGKVVDSTESEAVRCERLKFKVREVKMESAEESPKTSQENVLLKHQEVLEKKEAPAFNDVIEETASKLVEERKSMVKALVGAFESVILLQEPEGQSPTAMDPERRDSKHGSPVGERRTHSNDSADSSVAHVDESD